MLAAMSDETTTETTELEPKRAAEMIASGEAQLVDVRQDFEWDAGRIPGALHIPLDALPSRSGEIDRERPVIFQCRTGARSSMATEAFRASGIEAFNLAGGLEAWVEQGLELEPEDGNVALPRPDNS
jgi:rhodanese-related sulfurtransferase